MSPEGWEISLRQPVIQLTNASYHTYRNIKASGSLNDGFNLHGSGHDILFENIEGFNNMDEGFSSHDQIVCEIRGAKFWGNDNGIANGGGSTTTATDLQSFSNLGWGIAFAQGGPTVLRNVRAWNNGVAQLILTPGTEVSGENVKVYTPPWTTKPWLNYQESSGRSASEAFRNEAGNSVPDGLVEVLPEEQAPANAFVLPRSGESSK